MTNSKLHNAVRLALGLSAGALALSAAPGAMAQDDGAKQIEEVVVTGSRIKRADLESASPVTVLNREEIMATGITDVGDLLQRLPSMGGSPIGTTTNNGGNGAVLIDLRGLGTIRTLTLVNGKRTVDGGDYQTIPATMIERVEILKDGASAVYGADAVAGVVNIITRRDFEGVSLEYLGADGFDMDAGRQDSVSFIAGTAFDGGNVVIGTEWVKQEAAYQSDAPWGFFQDSYYIYPGGCENQVDAPYDGTPQGGCYPIGSSRIPEGRLRTLSQGTFMQSDQTTAALEPFDGRTYNYAPVNYIQTPYERINIFAEANFEISPSVKLTSGIRANFRESAQELAPQPYNSPTDPAYNGVFNGTAYSGISEANYYLVEAFNASGLALEPVIDARRRMVETKRRFTQDITQVQAYAGLEGTFKDVDWDVYYNKGQRDRTDNDFGQFYGPALSEALGPSADLTNDGVVNPLCYTDATYTTPIAGCVPFNMFGGPGTITQEMLDYVGVDLVDNFTSKLDQIGLNFSGSAFSLPGGDMGWAVGYEYRKEFFQSAPDSAKQQDQVTGNTGAGTIGQYSSNSVYGELLMPFFDNGSQAIDVTLGLRWDDFSTFGDDTTYQLGVEFQAMAGLKFRGTIGEVFRAPSIGELFAGVVDSFPTYVDPCDPNTNGTGVLAPGCAQASTQLDSQVLARVGGNPNLQAETGDTITVGAVWTPDFVDGLSVTIDWWQVELENLITSLGVQYILDDCYNNLNPAACDLVSRRADYSIAFISDASLNAAAATAEGVDTEVRYGFDTGVGRWDLAFLWAHMLDRTSQNFPGDTVNDLVGTRTTGSSGTNYSEDKINYSVTWALNDFNIAYLGEYISEVTSEAVLIPYEQKVDAQLYHDLIFGYDLTKTGTRFSLGLTNITDEEPPYIDQGFNAKTDPSIYRMFGRSYYLRIQQNF